MSLFSACAPEGGLCGPRKDAKKEAPHWADAFEKSRAMEDDPEYAQQQWARNQKEMQQADEVSMRLYSELDLLDHPDPTSAPRGSALHVEMVSDAVKKALNKDEQIKQAMAADKDVFQMFRTKSDADLAEVGLKRVDSAGGTPDGTPEK